MAQANYIGGGSITSSDTAAAATVTLTLIGAKPGTMQRISNISYYALGTVTAFSIQVFKNDGSTNVAQIGGQVGGAATGPLGPYNYNFEIPINCAANDNAKIVLTATGATAVGLSANYTLGT